MDYNDKIADALGEGLSHESAEAYANGVPMCELIDDQQDIEDVQETIRLEEKFNE